MVSSYYHDVTAYRLRLSTSSYNWRDEDYYFTTEVTPDELPLKVKIPRKSSVQYAYISAKRRGRSYTRERQTYIYWIGMYGGSLAPLAPNITVGDDATPTTSPTIAWVQPDNGKPKIDDIDLYMYRVLWHRVDGAGEGLGNWTVVHVWEATYKQYVLRDLMANTTYEAGMTAINTMGASPVTWFTFETK